MYSHKDEYRLMTTDAKSQMISGPTKNPENSNPRSPAWPREVIVYYIYNYTKIQCQCSTRIVERLRSYPSVFG